jgi:hypothetical protein
MREQFVGAVSAAMTVAMFVALTGVAVAMFINYRPVKKPVAGAETTTVHV